MRAVVSELSDVAFATIIAELVDDGYLEQIGVFRPLGRASPVITHSDLTRLSERGKRLIGLWVDDMTVNGVSFDHQTQTPVSCAVCMTTENLGSIYFSRPWLRVIHEDGTSEVHQLPPIDLCDTHRKLAALGDIVIGWCDDGNCRRWGVAGRRSPCGQPFRVLPKET